MKLFLASSIDITISLLALKIFKPAQEVRVLFITNAADTYENTWWIDLDRKAFTSLGYEIVDIDLRKVSKDVFTEQLEDIDLLHICGGSVLYLLSLLREKDLDKVLANSVSENKIMYSGTSAGSVIVSKRLDIYAYEEGEVKFAKDIKDFSGLGLVDFLIIPHCNNPKFVGSIKKMIDHLPENISPLILLNDNQAVWVENNQFEILSA